MTTIAEIETAIRRARPAESVKVLKGKVDDLVGLARLDGASPRLLVRVYDAEHVEIDGETFIDLDAGLYIDLLEAAKRGLRPRAV